MTTFREWPSDGGPHTADSIGQALSGMVARDGSGNPVPGMVAPPTVSAVGGAWKVQVGRFVYVRNVTGAARFSGLSASEQVDITDSAAIPAGQSRIDLVVWNAVSGALSVIAGTASASPVAPSAGGLAPVATVRVNNGDAGVVPARVAPAYVMSGGGASSVTNTVPLVLSGATGGASGFYWRDFIVTFPEAFEAVPHLQVTGVFPPESVQFAEVTQVTATGFSGRVVRVAHATVLPGSLTYTATEK